MARTVENGLLSVCVRLLLFAVWLCLLVYLFWPSWRLDSRLEASCTPCVCDCSSENSLSFPLDCEKEKRMIDLLIEELELVKAVGNETMQRGRSLLVDARKASSPYKEEAEKCSWGIEACESGRERADALVMEELKLSLLWKNRALQWGWKGNDMRHSI